jgi:hypothetical protein
MIEPKNVERGSQIGHTETWFLRGIETLRRRRHCIPLAVVLFMLIACLPVAQCFAANPSGKSKKTAPPPAPLAPGAYFGLNLPGETPEIFAPGIISIPGHVVGAPAFSPDGTECYFSVSIFDGINWTDNKILFTRYENGAWTPPALASFADGRQEGEPLFSRDGNRLYFTAQNTSGGRTDTDIFMVQRASKKDEWSKPQPLPAPLNSPKDEWHLSLTADGTMYFISNRDGGQGGMDIYRTVSKPGEPLHVENLGPPVNSEFNEADPAISPDGHTLVFYYDPKRPGVMYDSLFICFDNGHGGWTTPVNMGEEFNKPGHQGSPVFSRDGRVLFFSRLVGKQGDVYWVSTTALERFRKLSH